MSAKTNLPLPGVAPSPLHYPTVPCSTLGLHRVTLSHVASPPIRACPLLAGQAHPAAARFAAPELEHPSYNFLDCPSIPLKRAFPAWLNQAANALSPRLNSSYRQRRAPSPTTPQRPSSVKVICDALDLRDITASTTPTPTPPARAATSPQLSPSPKQHRSIVPARSDCDLCPQQQPLNLQPARHSLVQKQQHPQPFLRDIGPS